jgi:hypothetical protein
VAKLAQRAAGFIDLLPGEITVPGHALSFRVFGVFRGFNCFFLVVGAKNGVGLAISFLNSSLTLRRAAVEFHAWFTILFRNKKHNYGSQSCN